MDDQQHFMSGPIMSGPRRGSAVTLRDLLMIGFRHRALVGTSFVVIFLAVFLLVLLWPARYESQMKILVKRERLDPVVASEETARREPGQLITEEELNSEVELLKSRDLLAEIVAATRLHERETKLQALTRKLGWSGGEASADKDHRIALAVYDLEQELDVQPLKKSSLIQVTYSTRDPQLSVNVLKSLADRYLTKHLAVHRPAGAFGFFEQETERYRSQMADFEARLAQHGRDTGVVSVQVEKETVLRQLGELEAAEQTTRAQVAETSERIRSLEAQIARTPARATTEIRTGSARLLEQHQATLLTLELKRIELLETFQPTYPSVVELENQIAKIRTAIAAAEQSPLREESSNRDPTYDFLQAELAKNRSELAASRARAIATAGTIAAYKDKAQQLDRIELVQQDLVREAKQAEQNYLTYFRKREEARISDALDMQRIVNVAIAEQPTLPFEPLRPRRSLMLLLGAMFAGFVSVALALVSDYWDPSFRTPDEVEDFLGIRVLAAIPRKGR